MSQLNFTRGDTQSINITVTSNGTALDITNFRFRFTVKNTFDNKTDDTDALLVKSWNVHSNPTNGQTVLILDKTDAEVLPIGRYKYDIQYVNANDIKTILSGILVVKDDITKTNSL